MYSPHRHLTKPLLHALGLLLLSSLPATAAEPVQITDPQDIKIRDAFLEHTKKEVGGLTKEHFASVKIPETLCWVESPKMGMALTAYQLTGDKQYLRDFVTAAENMRSAIVKGPDGFLGWYGPPEKSLLDPAKPDAIVSEIQTDFRVTAVLARFAEIVDADPALKEEFGPRRDEYIALAKDHLVKKWDSSFVDLGDRGAVYRWNKDYKPALATLSLAQEKLALMIDGLVRLYVVTGDPQYAEKAAKLGLWFKRCLEFDGDRYAWNRWNPAGKWDVSLDNPAKWRSWIAKEPKGQWHASSVGSAVQLYDCGLVFNREDIGRFLKTQTKVCWNGDVQNPAFFQVNGTPAKDGERYIAPSLAPFDAKFASLVYEGPAQAFRVEKSGNAWHGGVLASDWLLGKYVTLKAGETPAHAEKGKAFLAKADPALVKQLAFKPEAPGFITPPAPTEAVLASMPAAQ